MEEQLQKLEVQATDKVHNHHHTVNLCYREYQYFDISHTAREQRDSSWHFKTQLPRPANLRSLVQKMGCLN